MKSRALLAVVFVIGCATGGIASQLVISPARAATTTAARWEYKCFQKDTEDTAALNAAGEKGWELVSTTLPRGVFSFCFKRALP